MKKSIFLILCLCFASVYTMGQTLDLGTKELPLPGVGAASERYTYTLTNVGAVDPYSSSAFVSQTLYFPDHIDYLFISVRPRSGDLYHFFGSSISVNTVNNYGGGYDFDFMTNDISKEFDNFLYHDKPRIGRGTVSFTLWIQSWELGESIEIDIHYTRFGPEVPSIGN